MILKTNFAEGDVFYAGTTTTSSALNGITYTVNKIPPIGTIMAWAKSLTGVPTLPSAWKECDGTTISDAESPMNGQAVPNLNGNANFLYGAATSGGTKTEDFLPAHTHTLTQRGDTTGSYANATGSTTAGTAWAAYAVVWVMRIK